MPFPIPQAPDWRIDWNTIETGASWIEAMKNCPQNPAFHGEGDAWTHTRAVCESLVSLPEWRALEMDERTVLFLAALLHDMAKPRCTRISEDGVITNHGHAAKGETVARTFLYEINAPPRLRERVTGLIRYHMVPFFLMERQDGDRLVMKISQTTRCDRLALLAKADALGRICSDRDELIEKVNIFKDYCLEHKCLDQPKKFASDHSRFIYFQNNGRVPDYHAYNDSKCNVILMSGLPAAGKDYWIETNGPNLPVVSLDDLRIQHNISPEENQGRLLAMVRETAREHLRRERPFIWNATNISRRVRSRCINLFKAYKAEIRIVHLETPHAELFERNRRRKNPVPEKVILRLLNQWQPPDITEAHQVEWVLE